MSELGQWLENQLKNRGWSYRAAEKETGVSKSMLEDIVKVEGFQPRLGVLARLSESLDVPLWQVVEMCGYPSGVSQSPSRRAERVANLIHSMPEMEVVLNRLAALSPDRVDGVLAFLEAIDR